MLVGGATGSRPSKAEGCCRVVRGGGVTEPTSGGL